MVLKIHNTLSGTKEPFAPVDKQHVRVYACGPTVYNFAHIGNARMAVANDLSDLIDVSQENPTEEAMAIDPLTEAVDSPESSKETGKEPDLTDEAALDAVAKRKVKKRSFFDKWVEKFTDSILED